MSQADRWMGPVLRHGVEARLDKQDSAERVTVSLDEDGQVQWGPVGMSVINDASRHSFHFWVHTDSDPERLNAIQILGRELASAGHTWDVIPVRPGEQP